MTELADKLEELERLRDGYFNLEAGLAKSETRRQKAERQRDLLLAALEAMCNSIMISGKYGCLRAWKRGQAAIAKAKGAEL